MWTADHSNRQFKQHITGVIFLYSRAEFTHKILSPSPLLSSQCHHGKNVSESHGDLEISVFLAGAAVCNPPTGTRPSCDPDVPSLVNQTRFDRSLPLLPRLLSFLQEKKEGSRLCLRVLILMRIKRWKFLINYFNVELSTWVKALFVVCICETRRMNRDRRHSNSKTACLFLVSMFWQ